MSFLCWIFALIALTSQPQQLPPEFIEGAMARSHPVVEQYFVGVEWQCSPDDDEQCYAGWEFGFDDAAGPITGP